MQGRRDRHRKTGAVPVRASIRIDALGLEHVIEGEIRMGEEG